MVGSEDYLTTIVIRVGFQMCRDARKGICLGVSSSGLMGEMKIKMTKVQRPSRLLTCEVLCCLPVFQISVVRDDVEGLREAF